MLQESLRLLHIQPDLHLIDQLNELCFVHDAIQICIYGSEKFLETFEEFLVLLQLEHERNVDEFSEG